VHSPRPAGARSRIPIETELDTARAQLQQLPLDELSQPGPLPDGSRMTPARNPLFTGRAADLKRVAAALKTGRTVAVAGPDGAGKTQLAIEFAHRFGRFFAGGVFWVSFTTPAEIPLQVAACGGAGGLDLRADFAELALDDQLHLVLRAWQADVPRLLVFDDCSDGDVLREWLPTTGGAHILLTCREPAWDPTLRVTPVPIGPLVREESASLLRRLRPDVQESANVVGQVAAELGDLPLALRVAGGFLYRYRGQVSPASLLELLRSRDILEHAGTIATTVEADMAVAAGPAGSRQLFGRRRSLQSSPVSRTFALSDRWLERSDPAGRAALPLLGRAACFAAGEPLPRDLLLEAAGPGGEAGLGVLLELGLLEADGDDLVLLHRSLAELTRFARLDEEARAAAEAATVAWTSAVNDAANADARLLALPHLEAVTAAARSRGEDERTAALCFELGRSLWAAGDLRRARANLELALEICEGVLGAADHRTINTLSCLGSLLQAQGDLAGAQAALERALQLAEGTLGWEHPDTAVILTNLAWALRYQGDLPGARSALERALEVSERSLGGDHPDTIDRLDGLGLLLKEQGDLPGARTYSSRALEALERTLGPEHPRTLLAISAVGQLLREIGDLSSARTYVEHALRVSEETLGPDHPDTAVAMDNMGTLLQAEGDLEGARAHIERALEIRERTLGGDSPATGGSYSNLGMLLRQLGEPDAARPYLEQALIVSQRVLGPYDPQTATSHNNLGTLLLELGDLYGAQPQLERALAIREQGLGADHPETATSLANVGALHIAYGDLSGARAYLARALEVREEVLGPDHALTAASRHDMGRLLRGLGDLEGARLQFELAVSVREAVLGPDDPLTLASLTDLDDVVRELGGGRSKWPGTPLPDAEYFERG
jgi:tetratricopeptide (TPR) repeat protein